MKRIEPPAKHTLAYAIRNNKPDEVHLAFGVSRKLFVAWCRDAGIPVPAVPHPGGCKKGEQIGGRSSKRPDRELWASLCAQHTREELQERFGVTYWTIWKWCKDYGIPMPVSMPCAPAASAPPQAVEVSERPPPDPPRAVPRLPLVDDVPRLASERPSYWCQPNIPIGGFT